MALLWAVVIVGSWEIVAGVRNRAKVARAADWQAAAAAVRAEFRPGDLIAIAPLWADALGRAELGDLMPLSMVGRADGRAYRRIFELSLRGAHTGDTTGLSAELVRSFGPIALSRYSQTPVEVPFDLIEHFAEAQPSGGAVERRTLEIDYQPRYGAALTITAHNQTGIAWSAIPDAAWQGSQLRLWFGLHDYYARKNARGPAEVRIDLDDGATQTPFTVALSYPKEQKLAELTLALPQTSGRPLHAIRITAWADSAPNHIVGVLGRLERLPR